MSETWVASHIAPTVYWRRKTCKQKTAMLSGQYQDEVCWRFSGAIWSVVERMLTEATEKGGVLE